MDIEPPALRSAVPDEVVPASEAPPFAEADWPEEHDVPEDPGPWLDAVLLFVVPFTLLAWLGVAYCLLGLWAGRTSPEGMIAFSSLVLLVPIGVAAALGTGVTMALLRRRGSARAARAVGWLALVCLAAAAISGFLPLTL
ncbi:hypothetical protein [Micromonospora sp. NPDC005806]|uniref:hypothetical protein n=1 Tax=Micromonospora sp. NPDC005806 TaxID=3364234 RepID=UPI00369227C3